MSLLQNNTELRHLAADIKSLLGSILEIDFCWKKLMGTIPDYPWTPKSPLPEICHYPRKYSLDDIDLIAKESIRTGVSGFEILVEEWGTSGKIRPTLGDLLNLLFRVGLERAADFLSSKLLGSHCQNEFDNNSTDCSGLHSDPLGHETVILDSNKHSAEISLFAVNTTLCETASSLKNKDKVENSYSLLNNLELQDNLHFSFNYLKEITGNFSEISVKNGGYKIGSGEFGEVFKAMLLISNSESKEVAVKKLNDMKRSSNAQFKQEIEVLLRCKHKNLVTLEGYSCDGPQMCLIYAYIPNGNLLESISYHGSDLTWEKRLDIAQGIAQGIVYLHTAFEMPYIHRDIKSANILLDDDFVPKVGDFGLVRIGSHGLHTVTQQKTQVVCGTQVYMAPEAFRGDVSVKIDTFSFGIVLLELLTGLPPYDEERDGSDLLTHVFESSVEPNSLLDRKAGQWIEDESEKLFEIAELCVEEKKCRPSMVKVLEMLINVASS